MLATRCAFLGDRCSPMSSSAHLVASITQTNLYTNLRNMIVSSLWPLTISVVFYTV
ncbi:MAG: Na+/H+ antiporter NhaC family protein, partial [Cyanobacteria bacterium J06576_12]